MVLRGLVLVLADIGCSIELIGAVVKCDVLFPAYRLFVDEGLGVDKEPFNADSVGWLRGFTGKLAG